MAKFGINDIVSIRNSSSGLKTGKGFQEIWLSPYEVVPSEDNFYSQDNIEELADSFLTVGQQQPTVLARIDEKFVIVSGHRRNLANIKNLERGYKEYGKVRYLYRDMTAAMLELSLLMGNAYNRELSAWEKTQQAQKLKEALLRAKREDGLEIHGKMRDMVAALLNESSSNIAKMESIFHYAIPEMQEAFRKGEIGISAAYEATKLSPTKQQEVVEQAAVDGRISVKEVIGRKEDRGRKERRDKSLQDVSADRDVEALWKWAKGSMRTAVQEVTEEIKKVFESNTPQKGWTITDWTIYMVRLIM